MNTPDRPHSRALRAARAVTLGGLALAAGACGTDAAAADDDTTADTAHDSATDTVSDTEDDAHADTEPAADAPPDVPTDVPVDVALDTVPDAPPDTAADTGSDVLACSSVADNACPDGCVADTDYDCCMAQNDEFTFCDFLPDQGCACAVEGPFAPPSFLC